MLGWLTKRVVSMLISLMTFYVPHEQYQRLLDTLPTPEERVMGVDLQGWSILKAPSPVSGLTHYWFAYPPASDTLPWLVCLHGFNTDGRVFFNLSKLSDRYRIIAYNFPENTQLYQGSMDDFTVVLNDFLSVIGADTLTLVGNSIGGAVALHYVADTGRVATVSRLVLLSTTVFGSSPDDTREIRGMADKLLPYPDYKLYYLLNKGKALVSRFGRTELGEGTPSEALAIKHVRWYRQVLQSLYSYNAVPLARTVHVPVLAVHGATDRLISATRAQAVLKLIPGAAYVSIAGVGHTLVHERADTVAALIATK